MKLKETWKLSYANDLIEKHIYWAETHFLLGKFYKTYTYEDFL